MSLFELEREEDTDGLVELLTSSEKPEVRAHAAEILGRLGSKGAWDLNSPVTDALIDTIKSDDNGYVRAQAIDALDQHSVDAIQQLLVNLSDKLTPEAVSGADWVSVRAFGELLQSDVPEIRMAAVTGLGKIGDSEVVEPLLKRFSDDDLRVRVRAIRSVGRLGDPRAVESVVSLLDSPSPEIRRTAANALGSIGTDAAIGALEHLLDDENESIRRIAVDGLGNSRDPSAALALVHALTDESESVAQAAVLSLVELLSNAPAQRSHEMREAAIETLDTAASDRVVRPLIDLTESDLSAQRRNATWLLGRIGDPTDETVIRTLVSLLEDTDERTAQFAATSLVELNSQLAEEPLLDLLTDPGMPVGARARASYVLGNIGGEQARDTLSELVNSVENDNLRRQLLSALSKLGGTQLDTTTGD